MQRSNKFIEMVLYQVPRVTENEVHTKFTLIFTAALRSAHN